jgi:hypothetical protein
MWKTWLRDEPAAPRFEVNGDMAQAEAELGNRDRAFAILQDMARRRAPELIGVNLRPELQSLHSDPRYNQLLESIGLPPL